MALIESVSIPLGSDLPAFNLKDPQGKPHTFSDLMGEKGLLIGFLCNHCPYAIAVWPRFVRLAALAAENGIGACAINPNIHPDYPEDSPPNMIKKIEEWGIQFPYLVDEDQSAARAFKAQCTPDIYLFDGDGRLAYHGRIDDNWQDEGKVTREELKDAITALGAGQPVPEKQFPSMGCSIKWKS